MRKDQMEQQPTHEISAVYFPKTGDVECTWLDKETGEEVAITFPVTHEQGMKLARIVSPCVYSPAVRGGNALVDVLRERARQDDLWGEQNHDPFTYLSILMEEVGEVAKEAIEARFRGWSKSGDTIESEREWTERKLQLMREELVQVAAVALAMVQCLDRNNWSWTKAERKDKERYDTDVV